MGTAFSFSCSSAKGLGRGLTGISGSSSSSSPAGRGERDMRVSFNTFLLPWLLCSEPHHEPPASSKQRWWQASSGHKDVGRVQPKCLPFPEAGSRFELSSPEASRNGARSKAGPCYCVLCLRAGLTASPVLTSWGWRVPGRGHTRDHPRGEASPSLLPTSSQDAHPGSQPRGRGPSPR